MEESQREETMTDPQETTAAKIERLFASAHAACSACDGTRKTKISHSSCWGTLSHGALDALRDEALKLAGDDTKKAEYRQMLEQETTRLKAEVERLEKMRPCSPGLTHRNDCEAASDEPDR